jgi:hypothetical protein
MRSRDADHPYPGAVGPTRPGCPPADTAVDQGKGKGSPPRARHRLPLVTVAVLAARFQTSPRTVRRWLQVGHLQGEKLGGRWVLQDPDTPPAGRQQSSAPRGAEVRQVRARLRQVGARLIAVGNQVAQAQRRRGAVFLTWRRRGKLQVTLAIGREHPTRGWAPHALGLEYPFWLADRARWRPVLPLLRRYEQLRLWCAPALLRIPGVSAVVVRALTRLEAALVALHPPETYPASVEAPVPTAGDAAAPGVDTVERGPGDTGPRTPGRQT